MNRFGAGILGCALLLCLTACGNNDAAEDAGPERPLVALIMKSLANEFFVNMENGARLHQSRHSETYELVINGIKDESDLTQQVALVEQMMAKGVDAIVIAPADSRALIPVLVRAAERGIAVVNIDNKLDSEILAESATSIPFVGPDDQRGAMLAGQYVARKLEPSSQVAIVGGISTAFNSQLRQAGFEAAMQEAGMNVVSIQSGEWEQGKASTIAAALISEYPQLRALLCSNDNMAYGAIAAVRQAGKTGEIHVVGFDNLSASRELLLDGSMLATVDQFGDQLAIQGIEYALQILNGGVVPEDQVTAVSLVTAETL